MKRLIIWLIVLLLCQTAFAIVNHRTYISAQQNYRVGNYLNAKLNLENLEPEYKLAPEYALLMGKICLAMGNYIEAYDWLQKFSKGYIGNEPIAEPELIELIQDAAKIQKNTDLSMAVGAPKGKVNSYDSEYAPVINYNGNMMFLSSLKRSIFGKENIFVSKLNDGVWLEPMEIEELNTDFNECVGSISEDGNKLYLFGYYNKSKKTNGDIYYSTLTSKGKWSAPKMIEEVSSNYYDLQPYVYKESLMFFASNRDGKHDNYDIFVSEFKNGVWGTPINLGPIINTMFDEQAPFLDWDGKTLYFSSRGHKGFGGDDIFKAEKIGASWTEWSKPVNLGPIVNSVLDDRYFFIAQNSPLAYFSSNRHNGMGLEDIYTIDMSVFRALMDEINGMKEQKVIESVVYNAIINGVVVDEQDKPISTKVTLSYTLNKEPQTKVVTSAADGKFSQPLACDMESLTYQCKPLGYENAEGKIDLSKIETTGDAPPVVFVKISCRKLGKGEAFDVRVTGRVINEQNKPVMTDVYWYYVDNNELNEVIVETNEDGSFLFYVPRISQLKYMIKDPRFAPKEEMLQIPPDVNAYDVRIKVLTVGNDIKISGKVVDKNDEPVVADLYWYYTAGEQAVEYHVTSKPDGTYTVSVQRNGKINYRVEKKNYMQVTGSMDLPLTKREHNKDFTLYKLDISESFRLDNVLFDFNKATLLPVSYEVLAPVVSTMIANPTLNIELSGHTDNIGGKDYNQRLSEARAKAVADYLISKGVEKERIVARGYGFEKPVADNKTDAGRAKNRRTELKVLGIEFEKDTTELIVAGFESAGTMPKVTKTIKAERGIKAEGISPALDTQFKQMVIDAVKGEKGSLRVDMFVTKGSVQSVKIYPVTGQFTEKVLNDVAAKLTGWKIETDKSFVHAMDIEVK